MTDLLTYLQEKKTEGADSLSLTQFLEDNEGYIISTRPCKPHKTLTWKVVKSFWIHEFAAHVKNTNDGMVTFSQNFNIRVLTLQRLTTGYLQPQRG